MNLFDPPKFPEPFKPEPLWQMNTCPDCKNDLVCYDQGECLRPTPTPETDAARLQISCDDSSCGIYCHTQDGSEYTGEVCQSDRMAEIERQLAKSREETARLRQALEKSKEFVQSWGELIDTHFHTTP